MKCIFILLIQCVWSIAATNPVDSEQLKKILARYQNMSSLEVSFKQIKTFKDMPMQLRSEGILKIQPPDKVVWKVIKPQALEMVLEHDRILLRTQRLQRTQRLHGRETPQGTQETQGHPENLDYQETFQTSQASAQEQRSFQDLLNWLRLDADAISNNYEILRVANNQYRFTSKKPPSFIRALNMHLSPTGHLKSLTFEESAGDQIRIEFAHAKVRYAAQHALKNKNRR